MNYALVNYPKINSTNIDEYRKRYDPAFEVVRPHITLMAGIPTNEVNEESLIAHLGAVIRKQNSFSITLRGVSTSSDGLLIYLNVEEGKDQLRQIHEDIYTGMLSGYIFPHLPFNPHVTLGLFSKTNDNSERALKEAVDANFYFKYTADSFHLIVGDGLKPISLVEELLIK